MKSLFFVRIDKWLTVFLRTFQYPIELYIWLWLCQINFIFFGEKVDLNKKEMVKSIFRHIKYYWFKRNSGNTKKKLQFCSSVFHFVEMANQVVQVVLRCETANETEHLGNKTMPNKRKSNSCLTFMITYAMYIIQSYILIYDLQFSLITHCRVNIEIYHTVYRVHLPSDNCLKKIKCKLQFEIKAIVLLVFHLIK